jgi:mRNA-degrading endonuclease RelE of RelBE toxin-antitoxin system
MKPVSLQIRYERKAEKFLLRNQNKITNKETRELIIKAISKLTGKDENIDIVKMKGEFEGYFRIRKNDLRIIFSIYEDENTIVVTVANIDFRGNVYK